MRKTPFIWLGSGRTRKRTVAHKGKLLDQAARSGLPVPAGGILLDDFFQICQEEGIIEQAGDLVIVPDAIWLHEVLFRDIRFPRLEKSVALRPASSHISGEHSELERARLNIDLGDAEQMAGALSAVWSVLKGDANETAFDVLVMEMVNIQRMGEALTSLELEKDQVHEKEGIIAGSIRSYDLRKIKTFQRASTDKPLYIRRLQKLLRGVRRSFGKEDRRIEWADDGQICWLLQVD